jgi:mevalonate kinase
MAETRIVQAQCPGKLILSGEHAVVYGAPALVSAVSLGARAEAMASSDGLWHLALGEGLWQQSYTPAALASVLAAAEARHAAFLAGQLAIGQVLGEPGELLACGVALASRDLAATPLRVTVKFDLPLGAGMGSSAAVLGAAMQAVRAWYGQAWTRPELTAGVLAGERLMHGRSSGADPHTCCHGGTWHFQRGAASPVTDLVWPPLSVIHTGRPASSTGECVAQVAAGRYSESAWQLFAATTESVLLALRSGDAAALRAAFRENHRQLCAIGVTPPRVQQFIAELEAHGGAAKICGAGAVRGEAAGVLLALGEVPAELLASYGYQALSLTMDHPGCTWQPSV